MQDRIIIIMLHCSTVISTWNLFLIFMKLPTFLQTWLCYVRPFFWKRRFLFNLFLFSLLLIVKCAGSKTITKGVFFMYKMLFKPTCKQHFVLRPCRSVSLRTCSLTTSTAPVRWPGGWGASVRPSDPWRHWTLLGWSGSGPTRPCAFSRTGRAAWFLFCSLLLYPYVWHFYFCPDLRLYFLSLFCLSLTKSNNSCSLCNGECLYLCLAVRRSMIKNIKKSQRQCKWDSWSFAWW